MKIEVAIVIHAILVQKLGPTPNGKCYWYWDCYKQPSSRLLFVMGNISGKCEIFYKYILLLYWKQVPSIRQHWLALLHNERIYILEKIFSWSCWVIWHPNCQNTAKKLRNRIIRKLLTYALSPVKVFQHFLQISIVLSIYSILQKKTAMPVTI